MQLLVGEAKEVRVVQCNGSLVSEGLAKEDITVAEVLLFGIEYLYQSHYHVVHHQRQHQQ